MANNTKTQEEIRLQPRSFGKTISTLLHFLASCKAEESSIYEGKDFICFSRKALSSHTEQVQQQEREKIERYLNNGKKHDYEALGMGSLDYHEKCAVDGYIEWLRYFLTAPADIQQNAICTEHNIQGCKLQHKGFDTDEFERAAEALRSAEQGRKGSE